MLAEEKDIEICRVLIGWDSLEKRQREHNKTLPKVGHFRPPFSAPVIDFNLPGFQDASAASRYSSPWEVFSDLERLGKDPEVQANPRVLQKIHAQEAYLRVTLGEQQYFAEYVKSTMGFTPTLFTEEEIGQQKKAVEECLTSHGIQLDADIQRNLNKADEVIPRDKAGDFYREIMDRNLAALSTKIGGIPPFNFKVEFENVNAYWRNWVDGSQKDYRLRFNEQNVPVQYKSAATVLAFHEMLSHMVQAAILHDKIQQGVVPKCMGLTTVHGPEQFQSEGLAQTLTYFLDTSDTRPDLVAARRELMIYEAMVNSNVHLMVMSGKGILECHDYCTERLPFKTQIEIENGISNRVHNPQFRCYEYVYGSSAAFFKKFAQQASPSQKQEFLNRIYNDWLPVEELAGLIAGPLNPSSPKPASLVMQSRL